jgi:hypothetical protein
MIKLSSLILELEKPTNIYAPGGGPAIDSDDELLKKGYKLGKPKINLSTGTSTSNVEYLPSFGQMRKDLAAIGKNLQPLKLSKNEDIAKLATALGVAVSRVSARLLDLDKMIKLHQQNIK